MKKKGLHNTHVAQRARKKKVFGNVRVDKRGKIVIFWCCNDHRLRVYPPKELQLQEGDRVLIVLLGDQPMRWNNLKKCVKSKKRRSKTTN